MFLGLEKKYLWKVRSQTVQNIFGCVKGFCLYPKSTREMRENCSRKRNTKSNRKKKNPDSKENKNNLQYER